MNTSNNSLQLLEFRVVTYTSKLSCSINGVEGKKHVGIDLRWIRDVMVCLDEECLLVEGKY